MTKARTLADMISDGVIGTTELADDVITPVKLDETGSYEIAGLTIDTLNPEIEITNTGQRAYSLNVTGTSFYLKDKSDAQNIIKVDEGGDISFYDPSGNAQLKWDASDKRLGIGTASPSYTIHAVESTGTSLFRTQGLNGYGLTISNDQNSGREYNFDIGSSAGQFSFSASSVERVRIDGSGNVGIATNSPVTLENRTTLQVSGNIKLGSANDEGLLSIGDVNSANANVGIWRGNGDVYGSSGNALGLGGYSGITITTGNSGLSSQSRRMIFRADGDIEVMNLQSAGGGVETNALYWKIQNSGNTGQYARLGGISAETVSNWGGDLLFHSKPANATPNDTTEERMRIMYDGRVCFLGGAGVANPKIMTYKFSGVGNGDTMNLSNTLRFSGLVMVGSDGNDTAAYVFAVADDSYYGQASTTQIIGESNTAYTYQTLSLSSPINSNLVLTASGSNTKNYVVMLIGVN